MKCKYAKSLSDVGWCKTASYYCTAEQEATCKRNMHCITNAEIITSNVKDIDCLTELIWNDSWSEIFNIPEFGTKQELLDWLRQPKEEA